MKSVDVSRVESINLVTNRYKFSIPLVIVKPIVPKNDSIIYLISTGLGGTNNIYKSVSYPFFDNHYFVSYEKQGYGNNMNKPSKRPNAYADELKEVVDYLQKTFPNKKIILLGESWGSSIVCLFLNKYPSYGIKAVVWNMPSRVINVSKLPWYGHLLTGLKIVLSFCFNIQTFNKSNDTSEVFSSNPMLIRISKIANANRLDNNLNIMAAWFSISKSWKIMFKVLSNKYNLDITYVQSGEDKLQEPKFINNLNQKYSNNPNYHFINKGFHILFYEEPINEELFKIIFNSSHSIA